jgi:hypothetical protein
MKRTFIISIEVEVNDEDLLRAAALRRALADGVDELDWLETQAAGGPGADLQMLLDPGSMWDEGCSINQSYVEEQL